MSGAVQALIGSLAGVVKDAFWSSVTLLLPGNGTNGAQNNTFIDSSANAFLITRNGNTTQGTFSPFSITPPYSTSTRGGSGYFDGTGDRLSLATATAFGNSSNTVEFWFYPTDSAVTYRGIYDSRSTTGTDTGYGIFQYGLTIEVYGNGLKVATAAAAFSVNTWTHVALVRNSGTCQLYINGVASGASATYSSNLTSTVRVIGDTVNTAFPFVGYVSNLREVTSAVYTSNFTPSTTPLTAITNTQLLLNFTNAGIIDNAMLNDLETVGNAQISTAQSKFGGSSILFDGTGDWLAIPSTQNFTFGTGDFTIEFWIYTANNGNLMNPATSTGTGYWGLLIQSGELKWNSAYNVTNLWAVTATSIQNSAWHHVAIARASGTTKVFFDGVSQSAASGTFTDPTNYSGVDGWKIGSGNLADFNGYIDDLRITKGVARYTANFTPPAAAFPTS